MPAVKREGKKGVYVELPADLDAEFRAFVARYPLGTISQHIALALRRHMDAPPSVEVPPLPAAGAAPVEEKPTGKRRKA